MRLLTRPPNRNDRSLSLHTLVLNNLVSDTIRAAQIARRSRLLFQPFHGFSRVRHPLRDRLGVAVKGRDFGDGGAESFGQGSGGFEVDVVDLGVGGHDGAEALDEGLVGGRGHECFVVLAGVPV